MEQGSWWLPFNKDIPSIIEQAGFEIADMDQMYLPGAPKIAAYNFWGSAIRSVGGFMTISFKVNGKRERRSGFRHTAFVGSQRFSRPNWNKIRMWKRSLWRLHVHLDGAAIRSCQVPLSAIEGKR